MTAAPTLVATSINPFNRLPEQMRAFLQWRRLGAEVVTFNVRAEAENLTTAGVPVDSIEVVSADNTAIEDTGKPIARIKPILEWMEHASRERISILVNSDIYPATHSCRVFDSFLSIAPAVALTREETPVLEDYDIDSLSPYRGGIDAFVFNEASLKKTNSVLSDLPASRAMCFGVPGWDFLLGAAIETAQIGGVVMDSGLLLHQSHETTYTNIKDFEQFSPSVAALANLDNEDYIKVAKAYAQRIDVSCQHWGSRTNMFRSMHFAQAQLEAQLLPAARRLAYVLCDRLPRLQQTYRQPALVGLIEAQHAQPRPSFYSLYSFFLCSKAKDQRFFDILAAIACGLGCMKRQMPLRPLPKEHDHAHALARINQAANGDPKQRRLELAYLLGLELIDHSVFDADLFSEITLACANEVERDAVELIGVFLDRHDLAA